MPRSLVNPPGLLDPTRAGYSHVASAPGEPVFIAGQVAAGPDGQVHSTDFADQVERAFANLEAALAGVGLGPEHVVRCGIHIVDHDAEKLEIVTAALRRTWGDQPPTGTLIGVAALALPDIRIEIDAVAIRPPMREAGGR